MYADDTQLYSSARAEHEEALVRTMERCIEDVEDWMVANKLKMNEDKTEILMCNPKKKAINVSSLSFKNTTVACSEKARNLGVIFSNDLSMEKHVSQLCKTVYFENHRIRHLSVF